MNTRGRAKFAATLTAGAVALLFCAGTQAGPDCSNKPDHPSCAGDPGGDGCALTMENPPAFAFGAASRKIKGRETFALSLANADGSCTVPLGPEDVENIGFHLDAASQGGAVTYRPDQDYPVYMVRFTVDADGLAVDPPRQLAGFTACCSHTDVDGTLGAEVVAVQYWRDSQVTDRRGIELIDTTACTDPDGPCPPTAFSTVFELSRAERDACMANLASQPGAAPEDAYRVGDCYRPDYGLAPVFANGGDTIYANVSTTGALGARYAIGRFVKKTGTDCGGLQDIGTGWCGPELITQHDDLDTRPRVEGVHPVTGTLAVDYDDGIEGGLRNIRIAFVEPDACVDETTNGNHWMSCLPRGLPSGVVKGRGPSWLPVTGGYDVLYVGFDSGTLDTVWAFTPSPSVTNDRELLTKANRATTGL
jgi:hypothetical protein